MFYNLGARMMGDNNYNSVVFYGISFMLEMISTQHGWIPFSGDEAVTSIVFFLFI